VGTDGQGLAPIGWLNPPLYNPTIVRLMHAFSPDRKKIVVDGVVSGGLNIVDPDGSAPDILVSPVGAVTALGW
jgi:hypothetical protein